MERRPQLLLKETVPTFQADAVVFGAGVMGMLVAKKLTDLGQRVVLVEKSPTLAKGASTKNHGWLHRGTAHAISIKDKNEARAVVSKLIYGYEYLKSYAWECVEDPFEPFFTITQDEQLADRAAKIWDELDVLYEEVPRQRLLDADPAISKKVQLHAFQTKDLRINSRILYQKLLTDIQSRGGIVMYDTSYAYANEETVEIQSREERMAVSANVFIYSPGVQIQEAFEKLTNQHLTITLWKSHLLLVPRVSKFSMVSLDRNQPIIINHGEVSVVNRAYDEYQSNSLDQTVDPEEVDRTFESLCNLYPQVRTVGGKLKSISCSKPALNGIEGQRYSVDSQIFEPIPHHYFVLPGKMTEAPYVADELLHHIYPTLDFSAVTQRPIDKFLL